MDEVARPVAIEIRPHPRSPGIALLPRRLQRRGGLAWGLLGATIATLCTFGPSFVFIISGAPIIDRIRTTGAFAASLTGITIGIRSA
jgi:hypothetical protein